MKWDEGFIDGYHTDKVIKGFNEEYRWLSNYWPCEVVWNGLTYKSSEAAYQAAKSLDPRIWEKFTTLGAGTSKKEGKLLDIREDWDNVKLGIMYQICLDKFVRNEDLKQKLLETDDRFLEETNWWGDTFWGVCKGVGQNHLGRILMEIRKRINLDNYD